MLLNIGSDILFCDFTIQLICAFWTNHLVSHKSEKQALLGLVPWYFDSNFMMIGQNPKEKKWKKIPWFLLKLKMADFLFSKSDSLHWECTLGSFQKIIRRKDHGVMVSGSKVMRSFTDSYIIAPPRHEFRDIFLESLRSRSLFFGLVSQWCDSNLVTIG